MPKHARKPRSSAARSQRRRSALSGAAASSAAADRPAQPPPEPPPIPAHKRSRTVSREAAEVAGPATTRHESNSNRGRAGAASWWTAAAAQLGWPRSRKVAALVVAAGIALVSGAMVSNLLAGAPAQTGASPNPTVIVGIPGGEVLREPSSPPAPTPTAEVTPQPTVSPTNSPAATAAQTPIAVAPAPTPSVPPATPSSAPPTVPPPATPQPAPTVAVAAVAQPDDAVAGFYGQVVGGDFDSAYALWSDRMKATYPRGENLDERFAGTSSIAFQELRVVEQGGGSATVQANFTETYDSGSNRQFIGYWRLVSVDGRWLLDEPNY